MSKINYNLKKIKALVLDMDGVLSPSTIPISPEGVPMRMGNVKDGYALQLAVKKGFKIAIITGGKSDSMEKRAQLLGITDYYQGVPDKLPLLKEWIERNGLKPENVAYMGDDIPDLPCMRYVGLPVAPFDAAWEAQQTAVYISKISGGYGAVRDVLQEILKVNDLWVEDKGMPDSFYTW